jgi:predicted HNH restriction endonuclease
MNGSCYFCGKRLGGKRGVNRHHKTPRRYFKGGKAAALNGNVVEVHKTCHQRFHQRYDDTTLDRQQFEVFIARFNWGNNLFAPQLTVSQPV